MNTERARVGWRFWFWWVLVSAVGTVVVMVVTALTFGADVANETFATLGILVVGGAVEGASVGIAQWLVLRRQVSRPGWWVLASTVGFAVGGTVAPAANAVMGEAVGFAVGQVVGGTLLGASVGIAQWFVLREWPVSRPGWWVLASIVGLVVSDAALTFGADIAIETSAMLGAGLVLLFGYGAITGAVLVWLLRQTHPEA